MGTHKIYAMHWGTGLKVGEVEAVCCEPLCSPWAEAGWAGASLHSGCLKQDAWLASQVWEDLTSR